MLYITCKLALQQVTTNLLRALEFTSHGPLTCLYPVLQTDMHNDLPGETNDWDSWLGQSAVTKASDKNCVNKLF